MIAGIIANQLTTITLGSPTIGNLTCTTYSGTNTYVNVPITNNDAETVTVRISLASNFAGAVTQTNVSYLQTVNLQIFHNSTGSAPGSVTVYARVEKTGFNTSAAVNKTQTLSMCSLG